MEDQETRILIDDFRVPQKVFYDWGEIRWAPTKNGDGIILFTGEPPDNVQDISCMPPNLWFRFGSSLVVAYIAKNLQVTFLDS